MRTDLTVVDIFGTMHDFAVEAPEGTPWQAVAAALERDGVMLATRLYAGAVAIGAHTIVGGDALRSGALIQAEAARPGPPLGLTLDVVGGRNAGRSLRLDGRHTIGRDRSCDLILDDPDVSRRHLEIRLHGGRVEAAELGSTNPTLVEGQQPGGVRPLHPDEVIQIGSSFLRLRGMRDTSGPPHLVPPSRITVPQVRPPIDANAGLGPTLISAGLPVLVGLISALLFHSPVLLLFALLTPVTVAGSTWATRRTRRVQTRRDEEEYRRRHAQAEREIAAAVALETHTRRLVTVDPVTLRRRSASNPERPAATSVSVGFGDARASIDVQGAAQPQLWAVPITIDLAASLTVRGPREVVDGLLRWLLCQLAANDEFDLLLVATERPDDWHWARWLPRLTVLSSPAERQEALRNLDQRHVVLISVDDEPPPDVPAGLRQVCVSLSGRSQGAQVVSLDDDARLSTHAESTRFVATCVDPDLAEEIARALAARPNSTTRGLPESCSLIEVLGLDRASLAEAVQTRWSTTHSTTLCATVGMSTAGNHVVDLDVDGPHALLAGTTGSGKSEFLKTVIFSLAASYSPDEVTFVLVDYKGGATFAACDALPHTVGLVTDLDLATTGRALRSLGAELRRREAVLSRANVADLATYRRTALDLPRLMIVVDEFAAMTAEFPEFIPGLIDIAQRGRSLGLHLVLATQRPAGVVSPEIRANTQLRIALRTVSAADSLDVLDCADAADIRVDTPGRAIQRGSPNCQFQVAQVSTGTASPTDVVVTQLRSWRRLPAQSLRNEAASDATLLSAAIAEAAAGLAKPRAPWLPALPKHLQRDDPRLTTDRPVLPIGLVDLPDRQCQEPLTIDLIDGGGLLLVGGPRSGRTVGLLSIAAGAALRKSPTNLEIYSIDCSGRGLAGLAAFPHTGTCVVLDDGFAAIARLVDRLTSRLALRRQQRTTERAPLVIVLLDGWGQFAAASEEYDLGRTSTALLAVVRDAAGSGVTVAITGDRTALTPRLTSAIRAKLVLGFPDAQDYSIAGVDGSQLPAPPVPGRGIRAADGAVFQLVDTSTAATPTWSARSKSASLIRVKHLPGVVEQSEIRAGYLCLGVGGDAVEPVWLDLRASARMLISGGPRSGRSTLLCSLLRQLVEAGVWVDVAAPQTSPVHQSAIAFGLSPIDQERSPDHLRSAVILVDDSDAFLDTSMGAALEAHIRAAPTQLVAVAARSDDPSINLRGLAYLVRRRRTGVLLRAGPLDGELLGLRLRREQLGGPPGRAIVVGEPDWGPGFGEPLVVQTLSR